MVDDNWFDCGWMVIWSVLVSPYGLSQSCEVFLWYYMRLTLAVWNDSTDLCLPCFALFYDCALSRETRKVCRLRIVTFGKQSEGVGQRRCLCRAVSVLAVIGSGEGQVKGRSRNDCDAGSSLAVSVRISCHRRECSINIWKSYLMKVT